MSRSGGGNEGECNLPEDYERRCEKGVESSREGQQEFIADEKVKDGPYSTGRVQLFLCASREEQSEDQ